MTIQLTIEEAQVLTQLIDLAVKSGGLNVAKASAVLADKIQDAVKAENKEGV